MPLEKTWIYIAFKFEKMPFIYAIYESIASPPPNYRLNNTASWALSLKGQLKALEKAMRKNSTIFPRKHQKFTVNNEKEAVKSYDRPYTEGTWY